MVKNLTILKVLEPFLSKPRDKLHLASISKEINEPHPTVRQWLSYLEKEGILRKTFQGRLTQYSLNFENQNLIDYLSISEKNRLIDLCKRELIMKELLDFIRKTPNECYFSLIFGSGVQNFKEADDIDILMAGKTGEINTTKFKKKFGKELHLVNVKNFRDISESLKAEIIKKHLIINGSENFLRWILWQA